ncbi:hypothetical protein [Roseospira goensis]|uniref:Uncharacterized protein n=1 Tax=Roseospira goensis TaxID=391922 RepID=A0A7W6RWW1_9PROT|nr:hypothetical protein [Roseospira goensis]MBB4284733.1 hypothetical protein [Roseospira goensis]
MATKPAGPKGARAGKAGSTGTPRAAAAAERRRAAQAKAIHDINEQLSGPVLAVYRTLLPDLQTLSYEDILTSPDLVNGCMLIFEKQRSLFQHLLVSEAGLPVTDDDEPLWCGRSIDDIRILVIRTTAKKYLRTHGDRFRDVKEHSNRADSKVNVGLLERLFDLVTRLWQGGPAQKPKPSAEKTRSGADVFYETIAPFLRHRWQVPLIPYYAALPRSLIREVGEGLLSLRRPEDLEFLLRIGRNDFNEAQTIAGDLTREMLDTDPRAASGVTHAGRQEYERLLTSLHHRMGPRFWKVFTGTELLDSLSTKSTADIIEMATHLDRVGPETVDSLVTFLQRPQIAPFLRVAEDTLPREDFDAIFGMPGNPRLARVFAQKAAQLRVEPAKLEDFETQLPFIFQAYRTAPEDFTRTL